MGSDIGKSAGGARCVTCGVQPPFRLDGDIKNVYLDDVPSAQYDKRHDLLAAGGVLSAVENR